MGQLHLRSAGQSPVGLVVICYPHCKHPCAPFICHFLCCGAMASSLPLAPLCCSTVPSPAAASLCSSTKLGARDGTSPTRLHQPTSSLSLNPKTFGLGFLRGSRLPLLHRIPLHVHASSLSPHRLLGRTHGDLSKMEPIRSWGSAFQGARGRQRQRRCMGGELRTWLAGPPLPPLQQPQKYVNEKLGPLFMRLHNSFFIWGMRANENMKYFSDDTVSTQKAHSLEAVCMCMGPHGTKPEPRCKPCLMKG